MAARVVIDGAQRRTAFRVAAGTACGQCPWRISNQGTRHAGGWYTKANLRRLWAGLRTGERMTCHPTDPAMDFGECSCHEPPPPGTPTRECAGALILVQREAQRINDLFLAGGNWADYRRDHPAGLTREGAAIVMMSAQFGGTPGLGVLEMAKPNLNDLAIGYERLTPWEPR